MKKGLVKLARWVGFTTHQREPRDRENPVPGYYVHSGELKEFHRAAYLGYRHKVQELLSRKKNVVDSRDRRNR